MPALAQIGAKFVRGLDDGGILLEQWQHRDLNRRKLGVKVQHHALLTFYFFLIVGVDEKRQRAAVRAGGRFDDVGNDFLFRLLVEVFKRLAAELGMLLEVIVGSIGDASVESSEELPPLSFRIRYIGALFSLAVEPVHTGHSRQVSFHSALSLMDLETRDHLVQ